ncbi:MAG: SRPBCC family protein [Chloroflexi bacterium]|nr:SRPBCC family protein [Chloroflexota bacterium]
MISNQVRLTIARPASDVFAHVTDPRQFSQFNSIVEPTNILSKTPPAVGSTFTLNVHDGAQAVPVRVEVTRYDPSKMFAYRSLSGEPLSVLARYFFDDEGSKTRIIYAQELTPHRPPDTTGAGNIQRDIQTHLEHDLAQLKASLETT